MFWRVICLVILFDTDQDQNPTTATPNFLHDSDIRNYLRRNCQFRGQYQFRFQFGTIFIGMEEGS